MSDNISYGGQAVIEGVMMRSPRFFSVACRRQSDGEIVVRTEPVPAFFTRYAWARWPFMRGVFALADAMVLGMKALLWSANIAHQDDLAAGKVSDTPATSGGRTDTVSGLVVSGSVFAGMGIGIALFVLMPSLLVGWLPKVDSALGRNVLEGGLRVVLFLGYIQLISRMEHVKRLFGYHGAEHKAINTLEADEALTLPNCVAQTRLHPRCGTSFAIIVLLLGFLVFTFVPRYPVSGGRQGIAIVDVTVRVAIEIMILPFVAGVAYELLRLAGKFRNQSAVMWLFKPGIWSQFLTTREPDDSQIDVALAALSTVLAAERRGGVQVEEADAPETVPGLLL